LADQPSASDASNRSGPLPAGAEKPRRRWLTRLGIVAVVLAVTSAIVTVLVVAGYTPISPSTQVVLSLFALDGFFILLLACLLGIELWLLFAARRARAAGSRLHIRMVALFAGIAAVPAILIAAVGSITLERTLNPSFMKDVGTFINNTGRVAQITSQSYCKVLLRDTTLAASDLDRIQSLFADERALFRLYFTNRARIMEFTSAAMIKADGTIVERGTPPGSRVIKPEPGDYEDARKNEKACIVLDEGRTLAVLRSLENFPDTFVYAERGIEPFVAEFPRQTNRLISYYRSFEALRSNIMIAFATTFALIAVTMLLAAAWLGLSFANRLVQPIRRLIAATDQVSSGNLYVQVPVNRAEGDLAHLGETFNNMTSELRLQQNRLVNASRINDERRLFTEAVLSGVPAAVIGTSANGEINVLNQYAQDMLAEFDADGQAGFIGKQLIDIVPELGDILSEASRAHIRVFQSQITLSRKGRDRMFVVRVTSELSSTSRRNQVVTLDDITDLVTAQRTSAWADVARRIAHEIKNPLTPIQLSAERLKRKYGRLITTDREVFDQCTDTIVRQVDDIKRMVDEFSSFARMPKATLAEDDLRECVRQVVFLMRVGNPEITIEDDLPDDPVMTRFDRRLLSQALTNLIKNATEGIKGAEEPVEHPQIDVSLEISHDGMLLIDIIDNGRGFPKENRHRLLEPYVTTRDEGTGLGLPIVAKILEDHGGGIELRDSPEGQGAWVRLYFPRERESVDTEAAVDATKPSASEIGGEYKTARTAE
jgi:two-component system nitrogen regulation sensor histidine kinase NtrY